MRWAYTFEETTISRIETIILLCVLVSWFTRRAGVHLASVWDIRSAFQQSNGYPSQYHNWFLCSKSCCLNLVSTKRCPSRYSDVTETLAFILQGCRCSGELARYSGDKIWTVCWKDLRSRDLCLNRALALLATKKPHWYNRPNAIFLCNSYSPRGGSLSLDNCDQ